MTRLYLTTLAATALVSALLVAAPSGANAQAPRSYCLIHPGGEPGGCGFPTLDACLADGAGFGTCLATERPAAWAPAAAASSAMRRR